MDTNGARAYTTPNHEEQSPPDALRHLQEQLGELQAYFTHFVSAKVDGILLSIRQLGLWAVVGVIGLIVLAALLVTAVVLVLTGMAAGVSLLFDARPWLGQIIVGIGVLILFTLALILGMRTWQRRSRQQKVQQYDERQRQQRATHEHSVADRAATDPALQYR